ncbi:MAG: NUDIX domain-containing protein [Planctomycetaceae bacterium]|nr:NUDIX domain-containing protein [Planctomycetaceae bacterium]
MEEYFDVVNDHDVVLESLPRSEVHHRKLKHRAVHVFVFRPDGRMLIHQRSATKEEFPSVWTSSCSGHVSAGEMYEQSAPRELQEELGISAPLTWLNKFDACADTSWEFTVLFSATTTEQPIPDPGEMTEIRWLQTSEIQGWMTNQPDDFSPAFRVLFKWYLQSL